ncbi:MAG: hypothetical protein HYR81_03615 [Nitrospirae bacterium]|nr:hypothetical protein [Nitrospirota bacterium]
MMKHTKIMIIAILTMVAALALTVPARAGQPITNTYFICPATSLNNANGHWVMGTHGAYYVLIPTNNTGSKVYLTIPVSVASLAQIPAGWALYNSLPSYPDFTGTVMLLQEGITDWLGSPSGWTEGDMTTVVSNGDGTYTVTDLRLAVSIIINHPVPLASAAAW